jgi:hypothetical protein
VGVQHTWDPEGIQLDGMAYPQEPCAKRPLRTMPTFDRQQLLKCRPRPLQQDLVAPNLIFTSCLAMAV